MRSLSAILIWCSVIALVVSLGLMNNGPTDQPTKKKQQDRKRITALIAQLGAAQFQAREEAAEELSGFGERALPELFRAMKLHPNQEVRTQAGKLYTDLLKIAVISKSTGLKMVAISPGSFTMGSPPKERGRQDDELQHKVRISQPFLLGRWEVTQEQYHKIMKTNPSYFAPKGGGNKILMTDATQKYPVEKVSWYDAIDFCNRLSQQDGYPPYYKIEKVFKPNNSITAAKVTIIGGNGYRLPTEAEWEYACRAGTPTLFHFGTSTKQNHANVKSQLQKGAYGIRRGWKSLNRTTDAGSYPANTWGLYDMHGNVAEWCWDYYDRDYYVKSPEIDPTGPATGKHRVVRGGSWLTADHLCRSASRFPIDPGQANYTTGFRVARNLSSLAD